MNAEEFKRKIDKITEEGTKNILNHFNRINDKIFTFNNILIAGYFAMSRIEDDINIKVIMIPLINLIFLIFLEYLMMEKSRKEAAINDPVEIDENDEDAGLKMLEDFVKFSENKETNPTLISFLAILTTFCVFVYFCYLLF